MVYANNTEVSSERSRAEIERTLQRYGADQFMYGWSEENAIVGFRMKSRQIKFLLPMPDKAVYAKTPTGKKRTNDQMLKEWEKGCRQKWRALALTIKAKLESVESGISIFEEEFLANIVLPNGQTYGQFAVPQINAAYENGSMPPLLPGGES